MSYFSIKTPEDSNSNGLTSIFLIKIQDAFDKFFDIIMS